MIDDLPPVSTVPAECGHCRRSGIDGFLYRMPSCPVHDRSDFGTFPPAPAVAVCRHSIYHHGCPSCDRQDPEERL